MKQAARPSQRPAVRSKALGVNTLGVKALGVNALGVLLLTGSMLLTVVPTQVMAAAGSRGEAIEQALAQSGGAGKVLGVSEQRGDDGRVTYLVKVLTNGRVRVVRINGR